MKIFKWIVLNLNILLVFTVLGQELPAIQPEKVGMSSERLGRIDNIFQQYVDDNIVPGAVALVLRKGKVVHFEAYGLSDINKKQKLKKDDLFRIASMTKPFVSVALLSLYEQGKFRLDDNLSKYLPEFKDPKVFVQEGGKEFTVPAKSEIKIRNILNHTAGFSYISDDPVGWAYSKAGVTHGLCRDPLTIAETVKRMGELPLMFHPGEQYHYSLAVDVQGRLIEVLSGLSLDEFLKQNIFGPLGIKDTHFFLPKEKVGRLVKVHKVEKGQVSGICETDYGDERSPYSTDYPYNGPQVHFAGGSGLSSTAEDYAKLCQMLLNGGELFGKRILGRKTIEIMTTNTIGDLVIDSQNNKFGLGFRVREFLGNGESGSVGEYGWGGYWHTQFVIDPKEEMITIHMCNLKPGHGTDLDKKLRILANQAIID